MFYAVPNYADNSQPQYYNPQGTVETCTGSENSISLSGWAFDRDDPNSSIQIHVYIGGSASSSNAEGYPLTTELYRSDVNNAYRINGNHGFSATIPTTKTGFQDVYIYACNLGGGQNQFLGSYTVEITTEKTPPVISDIQITNITNTQYTINCTVTDNYGIDKVMFPTWTDYNNQDDIIWYEGVLKDNRASCTIDISEHNNEHINYTTHIYAYDIHGNASLEIIWFSFPIKLTAVNELTANNKKYILYDNVQNLSWHEAKIYCEQQGGHLATLSTQSEYNAIKNMMQGTDFTQTFLGATDEENEGVWKWITGESWSYTNWNTNEPNNCDGNENYLALNNSGLDFTWNDIANFCEYDSAFICEIDLPHTETSVVNYGTYKLCEPEVFNMPEQYSIVVAAYKNNKLISCETRNSLDTNPYVLLGDIDKVKVLVWKDLKSLNPLCDSEEVTSNNFIKG